MILRYLFLSGGIFLSNILFSQSRDVTFPACRPAQSRIDLDINNVRASLFVSGSTWGLGYESTYEVPKGSKKNSLFTGGLWFGALDGNGQLMVAAQTYHQTGEDFWAGPVDTSTTLVSDSACWMFDRFWKLNRSEVEAFTQNYNDPSYTIPEAILSWPGNGNSSRGEAHYLAPFKDADGDGIYNPYKGDYPEFSFDGTPDCQKDLLGDQAVWYVFNDVGNAHTSTGGMPFGMEIHAMAFAYQTNDALNDATLYRYQLINRSVNSWNQMYMGQFTDADIGQFSDDYVGCDVTRGMGYGYNGNLYDGGLPQPILGTYGEHPPAVGIDFLQGPFAEPGDFIDNDQDGTVDETGERIKMSGFLYYENDFAAIGNPEDGDDYYNYMKGAWKDGSPVTYGGNGYGGSVNCKYMFPGNSDPSGWGTGGVPQPVWSEVTAGNWPYDRRFLVSAGPFAMLPGEVETVFIGVPWARDTAGTNLDAITKLQQADDYIQQLFDNCFSLPCSAFLPPSFTADINLNTVHFNATAADGNYYWTFGDNGSSTQKYPSHTYMVSGNYQVCLTVITSCDTETVCKNISVTVPMMECGPAIQRLEGQGSGHQIIDFTTASINEALVATDHRTHFPWYKPMHGPVKITYEDYNSLVDGDYRIAFDSTLNSSHWKMWFVGGTDTVYADSSIASGNKQLIPQWGLAVEVKQVPDPGNNSNPEKNGFREATLTFSDPQKNWLTGVEDVDFPSSYNWIRAGVSRANNIPSADPCVNAFDDRFAGIAAVDSGSYYESVLGGTWAPYRLCADNHNPASPYDCYTTGPVYPSASTTIQNKIENLANVDVVFTADKSKWSRCMVMETGANPSLTQNGQQPFMPRLHASVDKNGLTVAQGGISDVNNQEAADFVSGNGMGWFPGYAINIETGERLNIAFGENSSLTAENGRDMIWNPTSNEHAPLNEPLFGGMHYIYVFGHNGDVHYPLTNWILQGELRDMPLYDDGRWMNLIFSSSNALNERTEIFRDAMWVNIPMLNAGHQLLESDATVRLRVAKPFDSYNTSASPVNGDHPMYGFNIDRMNLGCNLYDGAVTVFPNPFSEFCTILFDNTSNSRYSLHLYDVRGRLVRKYEDIFTDRIIIQSAGLEQGVYIYSLQKDGQKPATGRIIVQ